MLYSFSCILRCIYTILSKFCVPVRLREDIFNKNLKKYKMYRKRNNYRNKQEINFTSVYKDHRFFYNIAS